MYFIIFLIMLLTILYFYINDKETFYNTELYPKSLNINVNCSNGNCGNSGNCSNCNSNPDVIVPIYAPWSTYYPYYSVYPYYYN